MAKVEPFSKSFPDPVVTANVYCHGHLDAVLLGAIKPFLQEVIEASKRDWRLWIMRYRRGGEHIKIRLHGDSSDAAAMKRELETYLDETLSQILWQEAGGPAKLTGAHDPTIDMEDSTIADYSPGTLIWTSYKRSHVTFGGEPYLGNDEYVALFAACLSAGLRHFLSNAAMIDGAVLHAVRIVVVAELVEAALRILELEDSCEYLSYHRDWLVRFVLLKTAHTPQEHQGVLAVFDKRLLHSASFWEQAREQITGAIAQPAITLREWQSAILNLMEYVNELCRREQVQIDPFALHSSHSALFKALHGVSNQAGFALLDEALVYHALRPQVPALVG
ncbi:MAG: hypothetical protein LAO76_01380 [Acidobacteriia bacterium]|nr:hypothetical protein [Terriglobia bacterium]